MLNILQILLLYKVVTIDVSLIEKKIKQLIIKWLKPTNQELWMAIFAQSAGTRPGPTLMGRVLLGLIRNRVMYGFQKKNQKRVQVGSGFY